MNIKDDQQVKKKKNRIRNENKCKWSASKNYTKQWSKNLKEKKSMLDLKVIFG